MSFSTENKLNLNTISKYLYKTSYKVYNEKNKSNNLLVKKANNLEQRKKNIMGIAAYNNVFSKRNLISLVVNSKEFGFIIKFNIYEKISIIPIKPLVSPDTGINVYNFILFFRKKKLPIYKINSNFIYKLSTYLLQNISQFSRIFYSYYTKLNVVGLGYKNFIVVNEIFFLLGDCNYIILEIPCDIKVYCKKAQLYLFSTSKDSLFNFTAKIKRLKKINYYKGKGILNFKNFKFLKLKTGKKQRFM